MRFLNCNIRSLEDAMVFPRYIKTKEHTFMKFLSTLFIISDKCLVFSSNKTHSLFLIYIKVMSNYKLGLQIAFHI
jgi:hypothetical protein